MITNSKEQRDNRMKQKVICLHCKGPKAGNLIVRSSIARHIRASHNQVAKNRKTNQLRGESFKIEVVEGEDYKVMNDQEPETARTPEARELETR